MDDKEIASLLQNAKVLVIEGYTANDGSRQQEGTVTAKITFCRPLKDEEIKQLADYMDKHVKFKHMGQEAIASVQTFNVGIYPTGHPDEDIPEKVFIESLQRVLGDKKLPIHRFPSVKEEYDLIQQLEQSTDQTGKSCMVVAELNPTTIKVPKVPDFKGQGPRGVA